MVLIEIGEGDVEYVFTSGYGGEFDGGRGVRFIREFARMVDGTYESIEYLFEVISVMQFECI